MFNVQIRNFVEIAYNNCFDIDGRYITTTSLAYFLQ